MVMRPKITNQIRRLRFEAGEMTQKDLAEKVGVTRQTIMAIEGAKYFPSLELAFLIARAFGQPLDAVFQCEEGT
ncbi:helix-turn-helix transcriptional regulator [Neogemmobacter tilapiae]